MSGPKPPPLEALAQVSDILGADPRAFTYMIGVLDAGADRHNPPPKPELEPFYELGHRHGAELARLLAGVDPGSLN